MDHLIKVCFRLLALINRIILPKYSKRDLTRLSKIDKAIVAWRYWVTTRSLG